MARQDRNWEIHRRRTRRAKLVKLRARFAKARTNDERNRVLAKVLRVSPTVKPEEFTALATASRA